MLGVKVGIVGASGLPLSGGLGASVTLSGGPSDTG